MLKLQYNDGSQRGVWLLEPKQRIGSDGTNDLTITEKGIEPFHIEVHIDGSSLELVPLNGETQLNGHLIKGKRDLKQGDVIRLAEVELIVADPSDQLAKSKAKVSEEISELASSKASTLNAKWFLVAELGSGQSKRYPVAGTMILGRSADTDISINYDRLSRRHAELTEADGVLHIKDLGSSNGTFLNGKAVTEHRVMPGDIVSFDKLKFKVIGPEQDINKTVMRPAIDLEAIQAAQTKAKAKAEKDKSIASASKTPSSSEASSGKTAVIVGAVVALVAIVGIIYFIAM